MKKPKSRRLKKNSQLKKSRKFLLKKFLLTSNKKLQHRLKKCLQKKLLHQPVQKLLLKQLLLHNVSRNPLTFLVMGTLDRAKLEGLRLKGFARIAQPHSFG